MTGQVKRIERKAEIGESRKLGRKNLLAGGVAMD
jgi:hypothetical protein